jgi:hypothetical protein
MPIHSCLDSCSALPPHTLKKLPGGFNRLPCAITLRSRQTTADVIETRRDESPGRLSSRS